MLNVITKEIIRVLGQEQDHIFDPFQLCEHSKNDLKLFQDYGLVRKLQPDELHNAILSYDLGESYKEYNFEVAGDSVICTPYDNIGNIFKVSFEHLDLYHTDHSTILERLANLNGFSYSGESIIEDNVVLIGSMENSTSKTEWFYVKKSLSFDPGILLKRNSNVVITSALEDTERFCARKDFVFLPFPVASDSFSVDHRKFITRANGFSAEKLASLSRIPLILDSEKKVLYMFGKLHGRDSVNDYRYAFTMATHFEELGREDLKDLLNKGGDSRTVVGQGRKELKKAILKKTLSEEPELAKEMIRLLGLEENENGNYKSNLRPSDFVIF